MAKKATRRRNAKRFRAWFTTRRGRRIYAKDYGYKGWPIRG